MTEVTEPDEVTMDEEDLDAFLGRGGTGVSWELRTELVSFLRRIAASTERP